MSKYRIPPSPELIWVRAIEATLSVRKTLRRQLHRIRARAIQRITVRGKEMLSCDKVAEDNGVDFFKNPDVGLKDSIVVEGEETFFDQDPNYSDETMPVAILDMVDGSDLLERDLGNWCSAIVVFDPRPHPPKILCSVVHDDRERIYSATQEGAFIDEPQYDEQGNIVRTPIRDQYGNITEHEVQYADRRRIQSPPPLVRETEQPKKGKPQPTNVGVCFYGQKEGHLSTTPLGLPQWLKDAIPNAAARIRIYTLAGNPMMVRLANGEMIHAVFEHVGQYPHDAVPGAFIALKAGARMFNIDTGQEMSENDLAASLLRPNNDAAKLRYVLSSDYEFGKSLTEALRRIRQPGTLVYKCDDCAQERAEPVLHLPQVLCTACGKPMRVSARTSSQTMS